MIDPVTVELSRLQFAVTALYHFLFVPLTLGLVWMLVRKRWGAAWAFVLIVFLLVRPQGIFGDARVARL